MKKLTRMIWVACLYGFVGMAFGAICGILVGAAVGMIVGGTEGTLKFAVFFGCVVSGGAFAVTGVLLDE